MAFTFIASATHTINASGTIIDCSSPLNVAAGDLLVAWFRFENVTTTATIADTVGGNVFTMDTLQSNGADFFSRLGYVLSATENATSTFRGTLAVAGYSRRIVVMQFRPDAGDTVTLDNSTGPATGSSTAIASTAITTTGTDEVVFCGASTYSTATYSVQSINSVAADGIVSPAGDANTWYRILSSTFTNGTGTATSSVNGKWICNIAAFKSTASGGGGVTYPQLERGMRGIERGVYSGGL